jgi:hypothetical protein
LELRFRQESYPGDPPDYKARTSASWQPERK